MPRGLTLCGRDEHRTTGRKMESRRAVLACTVLLNIITVVSSGCGVSPPNPTHRSQQGEAPAVTGPVMPYEANSTDDPAVQTWVHNETMRRTAAQYSDDVRQTSWLFRRNTSLPLPIIHPQTHDRPTCVRYEVSDSLIVLPPAPAAQGEDAHALAAQNRLTLAGASSGPSRSIEICK